MITQLYINSSAIVAPCIAINTVSPKFELASPFNGTMRIKEKDFSKHIPLNTSRRISSLGQWSLYAALSAVCENSNINPDCIITATGMGCVNETDNFLSQLINPENEIYSPTPFIQSTHNSIGGLIAMSLKNNQYNITFSNRNASFENALIDANICNSQEILIGAFEEISPFSQQAIELHYPINKNINDLFTLYDKEQNGMLIGEGSVFYCMSNICSDNSTSLIDDISIIDSNDDKIILDKDIEICLKKLNKNHNYDAIIMGCNGINLYDKWYHYIAKRHFPKVPILKYKHIVGESYTASAMALWFANQLFSNLDLIDYLLPDKPIHDLKEILIYNYFNNTHCFISLKKQ